MKQPRFIALDSLRGICAIFVAIYHFSTVSYISAIPFIGNGFLFVDFFFVLSGFVIAASYGDKLLEQFPIARFMFLRLGRLYPLHLFVLALYVVIALAKPDSGYSKSGFIITAFLLQAFSDGDLTNWNPPSWSISAEVWTYLAFALLCKTSKLVPILIIIVAVSPFALLQFSDRYLDVCYAGAMIRCLFGFSLGVLAYMAYRRYKLPTISRLVHSSMEFVSVGVCLVLVSVAGAGPLSFLCPIIFAATIYILAHEAGIISSVLNYKPFVFNGTLSYSIYMTHLFVQARLLNLIELLSRHVNFLPIAKEAAGRQTITNAAGFHFACDLTILMMVAVVVGVATLTFTFVEEPMRKKSKQSTAFERAVVPIGA